MNKFIESHHNKSLLQTPLKIVKFDRHKQVLRQRRHLQSVKVNDNLINEYRYNSSDGHKKATMEQVFGPLMTDDSDKPSIQDDSPWMLSWQVSERNMVWGDELRVSILKNSTAKNLGLTEKEITERLTQVSILIPEIDGKIKTMKQDVLTAFVANPSKLAERLVRLKHIFPSANVGEMLIKRVSLGLSEDLDHIEQGVQEIRKLLPKVNVDMLVQQNPVVLNFQSFKQALEDAKRMMPQQDLQAALIRDPQLVLSLQRGADMIPYDPVPELYQN